MKDFTSARRVAFVLLIWIGGSILACGSSGSGSLTDAGPDGSGASDAGDGRSTPPADAPFACGTETCGVDKYCVNPCCGGPPPQCLDSLADGGCPTGTQPSACIPSGGPNDGGPGCQTTECTPPPPYCADKPPQGCQPDKAGSRMLSCLCA